VLASFLFMNAAPPSIGIVTAQGSFRLDDATVTGNATLFEGATIESKARASLDLAAGPHVALLPESKGRIFGDRMILERGGGEFRDAAGFRMEARELRIYPETGQAWARVAFASANKVQVTALSGSFRVLNSRGLLIANLAPGAALEFEPVPQAAGGGRAATEPWKMTGCMRPASGHFTLTDEITNVTVELSGPDVAAAAGNRVEIIGTLNPAATPVSGATQVIQVSQVKRLGKGCVAAGKGAAAAGAGGAAGTAGKAAGAGGAHGAIGAGTVAIIGGVAAGAVLAGFAASDALPGQGGTVSR
jgi:hypothetical protein